LIKKVAKKSGFRVVCWEIFNLHKVDLRGISFCNDEAQKNSKDLLLLRVSARMRTSVVCTGGAPATLSETARPLSRTVTEIMET